MFILELLLTIFYFLIVLLVFALALALTIPLGVLYLVYWILFKSWRKSKKRNEIVTSKSKFNPKDISGIVNKAIRNKDKSNMSDELKNDILEYVEEAQNLSSKKNKSRAK